MRKLSIMWVGITMVYLVGPGLGWDRGANLALAANIKFNMPPEATGFNGTLVAKVADVKVPGDKWSPAGWFAIEEIRVVGFSRTGRISASDLTAAFKGKFENVGAKDGNVKYPELKVGDGVIVQCYQNEGHLRATRVALYAPGEEEPDCYLYLKKVEQGGKVSVLLAKVFDQASVALPMAKGADGKMAPRADLVSTVDALPEKTVVVAEVSGGTLKSIKAYEPPRQVEFVKRVTQKVHADATTKPALPERVLVGMEVKDYGTSVTMMIDPKAKGAASLGAKIASFKAGQLLLIHSTTDEQGTWLEDAKLDPDQEKVGDAPAKP